MSKKESTSTRVSDKLFENLKAQLEQFKKDYENASKGISDENRKIFDVII